MRPLPRFLLLALLTLAACGKGQITIISCGSAACDVSSGNVCCVTTASASCGGSCTGGPSFNCLGPTTCPGGICCVDDLGAHCAASCNGSQKPACEKSSDCGDFAGVCSGKTYLSSSGKPLLTIDVCGGA